MWRDERVVAVFNSPIGAPRFITDAKTTAQVDVQVTMGNTVTLPSRTVWSPQVDVDVSIECMSNTGIATVHVTLRLDTTKPASSGSVFYQVLKN